FMAVALRGTGPGLPAPLQLLSMLAQAVGVRAAGGAGLVALGRPQGLERLAQALPRARGDVEEDADVEVAAARALEAREPLAAHPDQLARRGPRGDLDRV